MLNALKLTVSVKAPPDAPSPPFVASRKMLWKNPASWPGLPVAPLAELTIPQSIVLVRVIVGPLGQTIGTIGNNALTLGREWDCARSRGWSERGALRARTRASHLGKRKAR